MTNKIKAQIMAVRDTGTSNMLDINGVMRVAYDLDLFELVNYLTERDNKKEYWHFIMTGEAPMDDEED